MRFGSAVLTLCSAPLLASCIFLLDYDELKGAPQSVGGAAGQPSTRGGESPGGAGGATPSCGDCNDADPCTIDTCLALPGEEPTCQHALTQGLKLDGFQAVLSSDRHERVALVGSGKRFYLSALTVEAGTPQVSLYRLADDATELEPITADLQLGGSPVSNMGLALEELAAGEVAVHGFVGVQSKSKGASTRVVHIQLREDRATSNAVGLSYRAGASTVFPQALAIGGEIVGAWIQEDGTIAAHSVGAARTDYFGDASLPAATLSLLSTNERRPAVLFTAEAEGEPLGVWVEALGGERTQLAECFVEPGAYTNSAVIPTQLPGIWLANVTRTGEGDRTNSGGTVVCRGVTCAAAPEECTEAPPSTSLRNVAGATVHFDTDEAGIVYSVVALPRVGPKSDGSGWEARLALSLGWADFNAEPVKTRELGALELDQTDAEPASGLAGPDWPAVAILPGQRAAVAWISPNPEGTGTELHVERYKMCLGEL